MNAGERLVRPWAGVYAEAAGIARNPPPPSADRYGWLVDCNGRIPSDMSTGTPEEVEEDGRLLYFAMTRAKDGLPQRLPQPCFVDACQYRALTLRA